MHAKLPKELQSSAGRRNFRDWEADLNRAIAAAKREYGFPEFLEEAFNRNFKKRKNRAGLQVAFEEVKKGKKEANHLLLILDSCKTFFLENSR